MHLLNLVPSKSVPKTLMELWCGRKLSMELSSTRAKREA